jgi:hypothetical protein
MRSPINTKGRSKPMTNSLVAELTTVSVIVISSNSQKYLKPVPAPYQA